MGMRRAQHMQPQCAVFRLVVDEMALPGEKSLVFEALGRQPRAETQVRRQNIHRASLDGGPYGRAARTLPENPMRANRVAAGQNGRNCISNIVTMRVL